MQLCKVRKPTGNMEVAVLQDGEVAFLHAAAQGRSLSDILHAGSPESIGSLFDAKSAVPVETVKLLPPLDAQEVWAAGVTYKRSREARERESEGAARFYDLVYRADRPELFFKATPRRVVGTHDLVQVRKDARWSVPEPELALVVSPA